MNILRWCNRIIEYSFYALFLLVPLALAGDTSELFEFNKMWTAFAIGIVIFAAWSIKSILKGQIKIQRTPLDIPIALFFLSQVLSTLFSLDQHISFWGYYSRWNGGLLSTILYIFLYYAFVSNIIAKQDPDENRRIIKRFLNIGILAGVIVGLWGLPSHFGFDPTCLIFRGNFDVSCWADDFQPKIRIFSTLGQPDWLAAYLTILIPLTVVSFINEVKDKLNKTLNLGSIKISYPAKLSKESIFYLLAFLLFYVDLLFTTSRSGFIAVLASILFLFLAQIFINRKKAQLFSPIFFGALIIVIAFFIGQPLNSDLSFDGLKNKLAPSQTANTQAEKPAPFHSGELGGTDSSKIRLLVWNGALNGWKENPLFGTGVETFAFAYYKYKTPQHNLTSEWNFLYNKAHNEFLNYLTTTGLLGLGTYLAMIGYFSFLVYKRAFKDKTSQDKLLVLGLFSSYIAIFITNFFGFSVVIVSIYFFLIPAFAFGTEALLNDQKKILIPARSSEEIDNPAPIQWIGISVTTLFCLFLLYNLLNFWNADKAYGYGSNLDRAGYYDQAIPYLQNAVRSRPGEPVFRDELALNSAIVASQLLAQAQDEEASESAQAAQKLSEQAIGLSDQLVNAYPNNYVFWKTRVRIFYTLAQVDPQFLTQALDAAKRAQSLAPNDASINYNLGVITGQTGSLDEAIKILERTIEMKPDYRDARYALGLFYHQKALGAGGKTVADRSYLEKAKEQMKYILSHISESDKQALEALKQLEEK